MNIAGTGAVSSGLKSIIPQLINGGVTIFVALYGIAVVGGHAGTDADFLHWLSKVWIVSLGALLSGSGAGSTSKAILKFLELMKAPGQPTIAITAPAGAKVSVDPEEQKQ
jgi:hypothetical protein